MAGETAPILRSVSWSSDEWNTGTLDQEGYDHAVQVSRPLYQTWNKTKPITLNAGEGLTIKHITNSTAGTFEITVLFTQELV